MSCKGIECIKRKASKPVDMGRYEAGQKRCQECSIFIIYEGKYCPCCNTILRTVPRKKKYKEQLRERLIA